MDNLVNIMGNLVNRMDNSDYIVYNSALFKTISREELQSNLTKRGISFGITDPYYILTLRYGTNDMKKIQMWDI